MKYFYVDIEYRAVFSTLVFAGNKEEAATKGKAEFDRKHPDATPLDKSRVEERVEVPETNEQDGPEPDSVW